MSVQREVSVGGLTEAFVFVSGVCEGEDTGVRMCLTFFLLTDSLA